MALADVDAGTNMELLEIKDGLARLKLTYWDREQAPNLLEDFMRPIRAGKLTFDGMDEVKVLEKKTDPQTQLEWRKVVIEGWSEIANIRKAGNAVWDYAKQMHEGDCQLCHYLDPIEKYQVVEWPVRIKRMKRYTKLSLQQQLLLARYLQRERYDLGPINGER
jgi:trimethylamine-N-oxide reductase cytochrome c-type subunit TorC